MPIATSEYGRKALGRAKKLKNLRRLFLQVVSPNLSSPGISQVEVTVNLPQPPFPYLLRSNILPTESETFLVRDVITTAEAEELHLNKMASNHTGSNRLTSNFTFDCTHRFIAEHKAILSPIRRIPPEILQSIFIHTLPATGKDSIPGSRVSRISQLPWALSQVCQVWRLSVLYFSVMWRDLPDVDLNEVYTTESPYLDFLTEMLKRSSNTPIRFNILGIGYENTAHPAIDMLTLHSNRWQEISIPSLLAFLPGFQKIKGRLSCLRSLSVLSVNYRSLSHTARDLFQTAPQLRHVHIVGPTSEFIFPTHQLVHYCPTSAFFNQVIQVIYSSLSLRVLRFSDISPNAEGSTLPMMALNLPDLTILDARFGWSTLDELFFNNLIIPEIKELRVETQAENVISPICSMILRSASPCLLKVLHLQLRFAPGELPRLLRLTPVLTNLSITDLPPTRDIFALILDGTTPPLVPLLDECMFVSRNDTGPSMEIVQALQLLASSRCELPANTTSTERLLSGEFHPLQTLQIYFGRRLSWYRQHLQGWVYSDMTDKLCKQRARLLAMIPPPHYRDLYFKRKFNLILRNRVIGLLTHLETLKIEKASDICISGIQHNLYEISVWFKDVEPSVSSKAEHILWKWEPILRGDMRNLRWVPTRFSLKYLSTTQNQALCLSPDAMKFIFYGIDANTA